jgi:hypothetical protein
MGYMEISLLPKSALRIKGKSATFIVNPQTAIPANAALFFDPQTGFSSDSTVVIKGAGEYEIGGVKITGIRNENGVLYSFSIDNMEVVAGTITLLSALQHKLKEFNIVVVNCDGITDASFLTALAVNAVLFYGEKAAEVAKGFEKEKLQNMNKYTATLGKLPAEMETILLS